MKIKMLMGLCALALLTRVGYTELNLELPETILSSDTASGFNGIPVNFSSIGIRRLRSVRKAAAVIEDPELNEWIRGIGRRLVAHTSYSNRPFYFVIVRNDDVNAFATQGGLIVINSGLILRSESESELAAVMAHEVAHVTQQHIERMIAESKQSRLGNAAAVVAGLLVGSKDASAGQAIVASAMAVDAHKSLRFGRAAETEADREGLRILANARFNPNGMTRFLRKLGGGDARYSGITEYLTSHPLTAKRVSDVGQRAALYGPYKGKSGPSYLYMREKIRVLTRHPVQNSKVSASVSNYGNALRAFQQGKAAVSTKMLLRGGRSKHELLLQARSLNQQRQFQQAVQLLKPLLARHPNDESFLIAMADALVGLQRSVEAWKLLEKVQLHEQTSLEFLGTRQEVARLAGRIGQAYLSIAERNIRIGLYTPALIQLTQARKVPNLTPYERQAVEQATFRAKQFRKR
ncbi:MAG: M48 family metalloprotease [Leucothrix sp.]